MMRNVARALGLCLSLPLFATVAFAQQQPFANIGDLKLENGGVIRQCRVGYRTFGKLAADKSNVVVYVTWASGTKVVKAKVFVVVAKEDHVVTPGPAIEFATLIGAKLLNLESDCGHLATVCEGKRLDAAVAEFLMI